MHDIKRDTIVGTTKFIILRFNFSFEFCYCQTYDGASNVVGKSVVLLVEYWKFRLLSFIVLDIHQVLLLRF